LLRTQTPYLWLKQIQKQDSLVCYTTPDAKQPGSQQDAKQPPQPYQRVRVGGVAKSLTKQPPLSQEYLILYRGQISGVFKIQRN
jgi:hypothetical protein